MDTVSDIKKCPECNAIFQGQPPKCPGCERSFSWPPKPKPSDTNLLVEESRKQTLQLQAVNSKLTFFVVIVVVWIILMVGSMIYAGFQR